MRVAGGLSLLRSSQERHPPRPGDALPAYPPAFISDTVHCDRLQATEGEAHARPMRCDTSAVCPDIAERRLSSFRHWTKLGTALREVGRYSEARTAFREARKLAPHVIDTALNLASLEMECGRYQHAYDMFQIVLRRLPQLVQVRIRTAHACHELGKKKRATMLIEDWPSWHLDDDMSAELAALLIQLGHVRDGLSIIREIPGLSRLSLYARVCAATALEQASCMEEARRCVASLPSPEEVCNPVLREGIFTLRASLAWRAGNLADARRLLEFLDTPPAPGICRSARPYLLLAEVCYQQSDLGAAKPALVAARSIWMKTADIASPDMFAS